MNAMQRFGRAVGGRPRKPSVGEGVHPAGPPLFRARTRGLTGYPPRNDRHGGGLVAGAAIV